LLLGFRAAESSADLPTDAEGRVMHLQVHRGQIANRILSVGDAGRAERLAKALFDSSKFAVHTSSRGFAVYTGMHKDVPVSIIATGMVRPHNARELLRARI
jgi:uridine phosphorylase